MEGALKLASAWGVRTGRDGGGAQGHRGNGVQRVERGRLMEEKERKRWEAG